MAVWALWVLRALQILWVLRVELWVAVLVAACSACFVSKTGPHWAVWGLTLILARWLAHYGQERVLRALSVWGLTVAACEAPFASKTGPGWVVWGRTLILARWLAHYGQERVLRALWGVTLAALWVVASAAVSSAVPRVPREG